MFAYTLYDSTIESEVWHCSYDSNFRAYQMFGSAVAETNLVDSTSCAWSVPTSLSHTDYPVGDYYIVAWSGSLYAGNLGTEVARTYAHRNPDWSWSVSVPDDRTRIISVTPADGATVATGTVAFEVTGYVNEDDVGSFLRVQLDYKKSGLASLSAPSDNLWCTTGVVPNESVCDFIEFPLETAGDFDVSTTTYMFDPGHFYMYTSVHTSDFFSWLWPSSSKSLVSTTTDFIVGYLTGGDVIAGAISDSWDELNATTTVSLATCNPLGGEFSVFNCMYALFVPDGYEMNRLFTAFYDGALTRVPLGYITRFVIILSGTTQVEPPALSYSFGSSSPAVLQSLTASDPLTFQIYDHFDVLSGVQADDGSGKDLWDIVMPWWNVVVTLALFIAIFYELSGIGISSDTTQVDSTHGVRDTRTTGYTFGKASRTVTRTRYRLKDEYKNQKK